jgi:hypothetical protein
MQFPLLTEAVRDKCRQLGFAPWSRRIDVAMPAFRLLRHAHFAASR